MLYVQGGCWAVGDASAQGSRAGSCACGASLPPVLTLTHPCLAAVQPGLGLPPPHLLLCAQRGRAAAAERSGAGRLAPLLLAAPASSAGSVHTSLSGSPGAWQTPRTGCTAPAMAPAACQGGARLPAAAACKEPRQSTAAPTPLTHPLPRVAAFCEPRLPVDACAAATQPCSWCTPPYLFGIPYPPAVYYGLPF